MNNTLPKGVTLETLKSYWDEAYTVYNPIFQRARILDGTDKAKLWKAIRAKFPAFQVLPDTNHVAYIKTNLLASLYSVGRCAEVTPTSEHDIDACIHINTMLDHIWSKHSVPYFQMQAGERAALLNIGITQVTWDPESISGKGEYLLSGAPIFKNINPLKFMRDPYASSLATSAYTITWDTFNKNVLKRNPLYKEGYASYEKKMNGTPKSEPVEQMTDKVLSSGKDSIRVVIYYVLQDKQIHEIHTIDSEFVLFVKEDIKPARHPFAILYCNEPAGDIFGVSEPSKAFANSVAYNLMHSIVLTSEVKNQNPPKFVNNQSQINLRDFIKHGADSDFTFVVQGDARQAVHYHEFPQVSPVIHSIMAGLGMDIQLVTGVDGKYTGKNTGSILTTGGMEQMLDQATLIDQPKIVQYEQYTKDLTELVLGNLIEYGTRRQYFIKDKNRNKFKTIGVDFSGLKEDGAVFDYALNISAHLPKNKQRIAQMANVLMEKQMQYNQQGQQGVSLITPEEWLMFQDLPFKELMLERMGGERQMDYVDQVARIVMQYASNVEQGMEPDDALLATADQIYSQQPATLGEQPPQPMVESPLI